MSTKSIPRRESSESISSENSDEESGPKSPEREIIRRILNLDSKHGLSGNLTKVPGGYKDEDPYVYVRGRGRGKYICEICQIRTTKPCMLRKHLRTHTDVRPFFCQHCQVYFRTKGNLTKHMKSKGHIKKCIQKGILLPVPMVVDDSQIKKDILTAQVVINQQSKAIDNADAEKKDDDMNQSTKKDKRKENEVAVAVGNITTKTIDQVGSSIICDKLQTREIILHNGQLLIQDKQQTSDYNEVTPVAIDKEVAAHCLLKLSNVPEQVKILMENKRETGEPAAKRPKLVRQKSTDDNSEVKKVSQLCIGSSAKPLQVVLLPNSSPTGSNVGSLKPIRMKGLPPLKSKDVTPDVVTERIEKLISSNYAIIDNVKPEPMRPRAVSRQNSAAKLSPGSSMDSVKGKKKTRNVKALSVSDLTKKETLDCLLCASIFETTEELKLHMAIHAELRPHVCQYCDGGFTTKQALLFHLKSHVKERPYVCGQCGDTFAESSEFKDHMTIHSTDTSNNQSDPLSSVTSLFPLDDVIDKTTEVQNE